MHKKGEPDDLFSKPSSLFSKSGFLKEFGSVTTNHATFTVLSETGNSDTPITLGSFVKRNSNASYIFDRHFVLEHADKLYGEVPINEFWLGQFLQPFNSHFAYGVSGTGVGFHSHTQALNLLFAGTKRWYFLAPQLRGWFRRWLHRSDTEHWGRDGFNVWNWLHHGPFQKMKRDLDKFERRAGFDLQTERGGFHSAIEECVQNAGEAMYIPYNSEHAVVNAGETIARVFREVQFTQAFYTYHARVANMKMVVDGNGNQFGTDKTDEMATATHTPHDEL